MYESSLRNPVLLRTHAASQVQVHRCHRVRLHYFDISAIGSRVQGRSSSPHGDAVTLQVCIPLHFHMTEAHRLDETRTLATIQAPRRALAPSPEHQERASSSAIVALRRYPLDLAGVPMSHIRLYSCLQLVLSVGIDDHPLKVLLLCLHESMHPVDNVFKASAVIVVMTTSEMVGRLSLI